MPGRDRLEGIRKRAFRDVHRDGLTEVVAGVALFVVALATGRPAFYWLYLVIVLVLGRGLEWLRERYTYPRIGLVQLEDDDRKSLSRGLLFWVVGTFALVAVILALLGVVGDHLAWRRAAPVLGGLLFAGGFLYLAQRTGLRRVYALAGAAVVLGVLLTGPASSAPYGNLRVWALLMGVLSLTVGGLAFHRFVRDTPVLSEWGDDAG